MSLVRWSTSCWYIYEPCGTNWHLEVCTFGQFSVPQILRDFSSINKKAKEEGYSFIERLELRAYLTLWSLFKIKRIQFKTYVNILNMVRLYGQIKQYANDPYNVFDSKYGVPKSLQVKPVLCNKSLREYEEKRRLREEIRNSPLYKLMKEGENESK